MAESLRRTAEDARGLVSDGREALANLNDLVQRQRVVLERQEKALKALEERTDRS